MNEDLTLNQTTSTSTTHPPGTALFLDLYRVSVIYSLILYITEQIYQYLARLWFSFIILIVGIVMAHKHFKNENGGFMTYGQGLSIGSLCL